MKSADKVFLAIIGAAVLGGGVFLVTRRGGGLAFAAPAAPAAPAPASYVAANAPTPQQQQQIATGVDGFGGLISGVTQAAQSIGSLVNLGKSLFGR